MYPDPSGEILLKIKYFASAIFINIWLFGQALNFIYFYFCKFVDLFCSFVILSPLLTIYMKTKAESQCWRRYISTKSF